MKLKARTTACFRQASTLVATIRSWFDRIDRATPAVLGLGALFLLSTPAQAAVAPPLGDAESFAILASSKIDNTGPTIVTGDLGIYPNGSSSVTGFPPGLVTGTMHFADAEALAAQDSLTVAYNNLAGQACNLTIPGDLGGMVLTPGVYCSGSSMGLTGILTLDAQGDPNAVFVFQMGSTLTTASGSSVNMINNGQASNVFWQVGSSATLGTGSALAGNILSQESITVTTGASTSGRLLARTGAVTLDTVTLSIPATITVNKDFSDNSPATVPVALTCTSGTITATPLNAAEGAPAVFTVTGAAPGATCTATETAPSGYTADQTGCVGVALNGSCTITNALNSDTIVVSKDFIPNSVASVPVALTCSSGTVTATPLNASEGAPAVFTVTGASPGATCTATETTPVGYAANQTDCVGVAPGSSCTITNTLNSNTVVVNKDFNPNSVASVPVALTCSSGTVTATPLNASEGAAAVFTVTGASPGATCTATETVPVGYTANQTDCVGVALGSSCTMTNTLNSNTVVVNKDFSPNSVASVPVALTCSSGTVTATPLNASEGAAAVFTVIGADPGATCTATETVPVGYTANQTDCAGVALGGSCTITNIRNNNTITVNKNFIPNSPAAAVNVNLVCTSGVVTATPLNASESLPAVFTVTGALPGATCTATETVPPGYTANQAGCAGVALGNSCTITNRLNSSTIVVNKDFTPDSVATVPVALTCTSGTITTTPLNASESLPAVFTVTGALPGATCTATETVPPGYTVNQTDCTGVTLGSSCTITNSFNSNTITVKKDFSPNSVATVPVALTCTSGTISATPLNASEAAAAVFTVTGANPGTTCTATETAPVGYTANQTNCAGVALGGSCTITNTLSSDTIVVNKDFIPNSVAAVPVALTCSSGTVTATPLSASEGAAAVFTVTGANPGTTCTATETTPVGYTANQAECAGVALGSSCTMTNTLNSNTIVVNKDFIPNSVAAVPVALTCSSGTVTATPLSASEGAAAVFTVTGASPGATCTATETTPVGYTANQADCAGVALGSSCTMTNTLNSNTIVVNKDFSPNSVASVPVALTCSSGTVTATPLNASESAAAVFTVTGASSGATCTATETVPPGYAANQTDCVEVPLGDSCTMTNILNGNTITVNKDFSDNSAATVPVALTCTSGTITTTPLNAAEGAPAVFTVTGAAAGATCTATETGPAGYTANQSGCVGVALNGSCTITNTSTVTSTPLQIPTISEWLMLLLTALLAIAGFAAMRRQAR